MVYILQIDNVHIHKKNTPAKNVLMLNFSGSITPHNSAIYSNREKLIFFRFCTSQNYCSKTFWNYEYK